MSLTQVLEQYMSGLPNLSNTLKKNLAEIRRLDVEVQKLSAENQKRIQNTVKSWKTMSKDTREKTYRDVKGNFAEMKRISDEKIKFAAKTYELVDKYIIRLDDETIKFQAAIRKKYADGSVVQDTKQEVDGTNRKRKSGMTRKDNKKSKDRKSEMPQVPDFVDAAPIVDMPVDPNEPTYCICHQVSFGQMVCCDNKNCSIEWFHFQCVGLTANPKGKWYCERCTDQMKRKKSIVK